ncbi:MAG: thioredoxin family protein [Elusimicrobiota bacterium]
MNARLNVLRPLAAAALVAGLIGYGCAEKAAFKAVKIGEPAPEFTLPDATGKPVSLSEAEGKYVVLEWHNLGCPFVKKHYGGGNMQALQKRFTKKGVLWYSIISSAPGKQGFMEPKQAREHFKKVGGSPTAVLLDPDGKVGRLYGAKTTPHMYVIDPKGVLRYNGAIDDIASADPDDVKDSKNYVAAALESLMEGGAVDEPLTRPYGCSVKYK